MSVERSWLRERLVTQIALERLIANVSFYMLHKHTALFELLAAQRTLVKHGLTMRHHVLLEKVVVSELFLAFLDRAENGQRLPIGVSFLMKLKTGRV